MFRFIIRDVLWLTVVVALAVCWGNDHRQLIDDVRKQRKDDNDCFDQMNKSLLSEASRISRETEQEVTIKTPYVIFVGSPETPVRRDTVRTSNKPD